MQYSANQESPAFRHGECQLMNMLYSDFAGVLGDNADIYMKMACAYIDDPDADEGKVFRIWKSRYVS